MREAAQRFFAQFQIVPGNVIETENQPFLRSKNGIRLPPMGEHTTETMQKISDQLSQLRAFIQQNQEYVGGSLTVSSSLDYSWYCLPNVLEQLALRRAWSRRKRIL